MLGEQVSRIFRPEVNTSTVSSSGAQHRRSRWAAGPAGRPPPAAWLLTDLRGVHQRRWTQVESIGLVAAPPQGTLTCADALPAGRTARRLAAQLFQFSPDIPVVVGTSSRSM